MKSPRATERWHATRRSFLRRAGLLTTVGMAGPWVRSRAAAHREERRKAAYRRRRLILDDDGDLVYSDQAKRGVEAFLDQRVTPLQGTPVDSIAWCIMWGIAQGKGQTRYWETQQLGKPLNDRVEDPTPPMVEAARTRSLEIFGSLRMNDCHDAFGMPAGKLLYPLKIQHPEWLLGDESQKGEAFTTLEAATWSGLNFAIPQVREDRLWWIRHSAESYDLDGLDLNFFRMPWYFKPGQEEKGAGAMTDLIRQARQVLDAVSQRRGRPCLLGVRTPGTLAACNRIGLDVESWLKEGLLDRLLIGGGYTAFNNPARELVRLGHHYGVPVYPCINCGLGIFARAETMRGAASNIFQAGADGIYLWNYHHRRQMPKHNTGHPTREAYELLDEIQSAEALRNRNKVFAVDYTLKLGPYSLASHPGEVPLALGHHPGETLRSLQLRVGDDLPAAERAGHLRKATLVLRLSGLRDADSLAVDCNGKALKMVRSDGAASAPGEPVERRYAVPGSLPCPGLNEVHLRIAARAPHADAPVTLEGVELSVLYR